MEEKKVMPILNITAMTWQPAKNNFFCEYVEEGKVKTQNWQLEK